MTKALSSAAAAAYKQVGFLGNDLNTCDDTLKWYVQNWLQTGKAIKWGAT